MVKISDMFIPALTAGVVMVILYSTMSYMPVVKSVPVCFCCVWLLAGGMLASALLKRKRGVLGLLDGAVVGALSAVVFSTLITILASVMLMLGVGLVGLEQFMHQMFPGYEYNVGGAIFALVFGVFFAFAFHLIPSLVLCAMGGILGAKILE